MRRRNPGISLFTVIALLLLLAPGAAPAAEPPQHDIRWVESTPLAEVPAAYLAESPGHGFNAWIAPDGVRVRSTDGAWQVGLALLAVGREGAMEKAKPAGVEARANRAELRRGSLTEWYVNDDRGLEQGFTLGRRPEGQTGGPVVVELALSTELVVRARPGGRGLDFFEPGTPLAVMSYGGLLVTDDRGEEIPARMKIIGGEEGGQKRLRILIEDLDAAYPLTVDPLLTTSSWASADTDGTRSVAWGDWDGDGDLDLAAGNDLANRVYRNDGGALTSVWTSTETDPTLSIAWGDWDGDGDLDLAAGNEGAANRVYENDGLGLSTSLTLVWSSVETDATQCIAWGDWDGDDDLDLAVGNLNQLNRVYENDGLGNSTSLVAAWASAGSDTTYSVAWADWDDDGDLDLAEGNANYQANRIYENDGLGQTTSLIPLWTSAEPDRTVGVAWGDWDGDGDFDLAVGNWDEADRVYENDGLGQATSLTSVWTSGQPDRSVEVAWGDWDGDGDLDLATGGNSFRKVYQNDGLGSSTSLTVAWSPLEVVNTQSVAWGDWDNDGDLDLVTGNRGQANRVYENDGDFLSLALVSIETDRTSSVAWGDWDGDGDLDLAVGNVLEPGLVFENGGGYLLLHWGFGVTPATTSVAWGDWDGDGDLDLAVGNSNHPNQVYESDGFGNPTLAWTSAEVEATRSLAWGDWDGDGDLDLAAGNGDSLPGQANRVYENDGLGQSTSLTSAWTSGDTDLTFSIAWGDWDGDGDLDLAAGNFGQVNRVYENTSGFLAPLWTSVDVDATFSVAWADWDGDGDLDLAAGNFGSANRVYDSDGLGNSNSLSTAWTCAETDSTASVAWGDWDGDGDLDLAAGNRGQANRVYVNDGLGNTDSLTSASWTSSQIEPTLSVAWGDWDDDGDLDLAAGNMDSADWIYQNGSLNRPGRLPETPVSPVLALRPGTTDAAFFHSTAECLSAPISIPFTLVDEENDSARRIVAEYSLTGGGSWTPATEGPGGSGTVDLAASPAGTPHTFVWDSPADGVLDAASATFRISVPYQASTRLAGPIQRAAMATASPPFRICETTVDLAVTKDDAVDTVVEGDTVVWAITVTNGGPNAVVGARVTDSFPSGVAGLAWTCAASSGASCENATGSGDLDELVDLEFGSTVTFVASGTVTSAAGPGLTNTATVTPPAGFFDTDPSNNSATDTDLGWPEIFSDGFESGDTTKWSSTVP